MYFISDRSWPEGCGLNMQPEWVFCYFILPAEHSQSWSAPLWNRVSSIGRAQTVSCLWQAEERERKSAPR